MSDAAPQLTGVTVLINAGDDGMDGNSSLKLFLENVDYSGDTNPTTYQGIWNATRGGYFDPNSTVPPFPMQWTGWRLGKPDINRGTKLRMEISAVGRDVLKGNVALQFSFIDGSTAMSNRQDFIIGTFHQPWRIYLDIHI